MTDDDWKPALVDGIRTQGVGDELVLLDRSYKRVHQLDRVGATILACCDGTMTVDGIVARLLQDFEVDEKQLEDDIPAFLARLRALNILS